MVKRTEEEIRQSMERINWEFEDYSSSKYPLDLNSIPWYPATFPAPIPKYLVALLSETEDVVLDPFGGKGTTAVETLKQRRRFVYNDLNPHAVTIMECLLEIIGRPIDEQVFNNMMDADRQELINYNMSYPEYEGKNLELLLKKLPEDILNQLMNRGIDEDSIFWFHAETLKELIRVFDRVEQFNGFENGIRKLAFLSILKDVSSQRGHFSYVTDNCKPSVMKYYNAINAYIEMLDRIQRACIDFYRQYRIINKKEDLEFIAQDCVIHSGNAKDCGFIDDCSVDLVVTSPPYLCAQDYILTMRLNNFFYPNQGFSILPFTEIGPRRLRTRRGIVDSYFNDMEFVLKEMYRVLKNNAYCCIIIGQGKGKVSHNISVIEHTIKIAEEVGFIKVFSTTRNIMYKNNRVGGVEKEDIILFRKHAYACTTKPNNKDTV